MKWTTMFRKQKSRAELKQQCRQLLDSMPVARGAPLVRLGSQYGGWQIVDDPSLSDSVAILAGVGEDISFDVELASFYNVTAVLVDPTDRAEAHFGLVAAAIGARKARPYSLGGLQEIESYELRDIGPGRLSFLKAALWKEDGEVTLIPPADPEAVSHSIFQKRNSEKDSSGGFVVKAVSPFSVFPASPERVRLAKLDIEGAELDLLPKLLAAFPNMTQLLVEFDFLKREELPSGVLVEEVLGALTDSGFQLVGRARDNFTFARGLE